MSTKFGGYNTPKSPCDNSKDILRKNFNNIVCLHEKLNNLDLNYLLDNHTYETQVVAGLNYKYSFVVNDHDVVLVVWKKLDNTFDVSLLSLHAQKIQN